jgi:hypothetical protein
MKKMCGQQIKKTGDPRKKSRFKPSLRQQELNVRSTVRKPVFHCLSGYSSFRSQYASKVLLTQQGNFFGMLQKRSGIVNQFPARLVI